MAVALESLPDDPSLLKAIILAQQEQITRFAATERAFDALVQALKIRIAKLQKQKFGPSSEKIESEIEQLQLALEDLEIALSAADTSAAPDQDEPADPPDTSPRRRRGKPRVVETRQTYVVGKRVEV